jgi:cell cycle checkpoint protein
MSNFSYFPLSPHIPTLGIKHSAASRGVNIDDLLSAENIVDNSPNNPTTGTAEANISVSLDGEYNADNDRLVSVDNEMYNNTTQPSAEEELEQLEKNNPQQERGNNDSMTMNHNSFSSVVVNNGNNQQAVPSQQSEDSAAFHFSLNNADVMITLLSTLLFERREEYCIINIFRPGIKFTAEKSRSMCARAYLKSNIFNEYNLREGLDNIELVVNLPNLLNCLQVFGSSAHLDLTYNDQDETLVLVLESEGVITDCTIKTLDPSIIHSQVSTSQIFEFRSHPLAARAVIKASYLRQVMNEMDVPGVNNVIICFTNQSPQLTMSAQGLLSEIYIEFPDCENNNFPQKMIGEFDCKIETGAQYYNWQLLKPAVKALSKADYTNMRLNDIGVLSLQHVIPAEDKQFTNWVEFLILPQENESQ